MVFFSRDPREFVGAMAQKRILKARLKSKQEETLSAAMDADALSTWKLFKHEMLVKIKKVRKKVIL